MHYSVAPITIVQLTLWTKKTLMRAVFGLIEIALPLLEIALLKALQHPIESLSLSWAIYIKSKLLIDETTT